MRSRHLYFLSFSIGSAVIYAFVKEVIETNIESELTTTTQTILNMARTDDIINVAGHRLSTDAMEEVLSDHHQRSSYKGGAMKKSLVPGIGHELRFHVNDTKTVPALFPEASEFKVMPNVFATGFMVGFFEWACIQAVNPHLDWPEEQTVGTHINVSHIAATPPGFEVTATVKLVEVDRRRLVFEIEANDGLDLIARGKHERFIIDKAKFDAKLKEKIENKSR